MKEVLVHSSRRLITYVLLLLTLMTLLVSPALARDKDKDIPVAGVSTGLIAICPPFGGGFQIGYWGSCLLFGDPPDISNACSPVDLDNYVGFRFPDVLTRNSSIDPDLAVIMDKAMDDMDQLMALSRALRATRDRYEGAVILGEQSCLDARLAEMISLNQALKEAGLQSQVSLRAYIVAQDSVDPAVLDAQVTKQDVKDVRDQIANGRFPDVDSVAISAWKLTDAELQLIQESASAIPNADIDAQFALWDPGQSERVSMRDLLSLISDNVCEQCFDPDLGNERMPTLTEWGLIALGILLAGSLAFMIHRRLRMMRVGTGA